MERRPKTKYYLFIDECGDHNLVNYDPAFPAFTLCGILVSSSCLNVLNREFNQLKMDVFDNTDIIIHSIDIRKWRKDFLALKNAELREKFFKGIESILSTSGVYTIVSCTIMKEQFGRFCTRANKNDVYGLSLEYLIERSIFCVDNLKENPEINIVVEKRGKKEDNRLLNFYNGLRNKGTKWVSADRLRSRIRHFGFQHKRDNIIGLQIADLIAYPITIHFLHPERENKSYEVVKHNIFSDKGILLGQKVIPH